MKMNVRTLVTMGLLIGLSVVLVLVTRIPMGFLFPIAPFLEYEMMDVPILIGSFMYGPIAGLLITLISCVIQGITVSGGSGWIGIMMHFIASGALALTAGFIYKYNHSVKGAVIALAAGTLAMTAIMLPTNLYVTTNFWGVPYDTVKAMIVPALIPFNFLKAGVNSIITFLVYKPLRKLISK